MRTAPDIAPASPVGTGGAELLSVPQLVSVVLALAGARPGSAALVSAREAASLAARLGLLRGDAKRAGLLHQ